MRIIDGDCHISPTREGGNSLFIEELIDRMDMAGVEMALTWLQPPYIKSHIDRSNRYVYEATKKYPHILRAVKELGANRVLFGSDTPFELMHVEVAKYIALLQNAVSSEDFALIMGGNIEREFRLMN